MNSKEVLKEIRTLLGFSEESKEVKMETATLVDGTIIEWEGELAVGTAIFVQTGEGLITAPDATHEVEGGLLVSTEGGIVTEIVEPTQTIEEEVALEEIPVEVPEEVSPMLAGEVLEAIAEAIAPVLEEVEALKEEMKKMKSGFSMTVDLVEKVANLPADEPIKAPAKLSKKEEQFANILKIAQQLKNK